MEVEMIELKTLKPEAISFALEKAKRYRLLNEPDDAESICLDVLATEPDNQEALITLLLSLTDKFAHGGLNPSFNQAKEIVVRLDTSYCKSYYMGIIYERRAKFHLKQGGPGAGVSAYDWFVKAMEMFLEALSGCDPKNQDAILRWNSCARIMNTHPEIQIDKTERQEMFLDSYETPH
jgi:hypothetical protein